MIITKNKSNFLYYLSMFRLTILFIFSNILFAHSNNIPFNLNKCGTLPPTIDLIIEESEIKDWLEQNPNNLYRDNLDISIAFHIIYENFSSNGGYIGESSINNQINVLNDAFDIANITFNLHSISYIENSNWYNDDDEYTYKEELAITPAEILNIYTTTAGGYLGYAYLPNQWPEDSFMHGIVLNPYTLPGGDWPYDQGDTAVHEVGHYLGLLHTFQEGCFGSGDYVSDTPAQNYGDNIYSCDESLDTCSSPGNDPVHNYMNYTDDECLTEFSNGQIDRMNFMIETYKPSLGCSSGYDCAGICGGTSILDCTGVCNGTAEEDCLGVCNGNSEIDECGICNGNGPMENMDCNGDCVVDIDCSGICGGTAQVDNCGICNGPGSVYACGCVDIPEGFCDCNLGVWDLCGICDNNPSNDCSQDCSGVWGGNSTIDECNVCEGDGTSCQIFGDLNNDGVINVTDIVLLVDWILSGNFQQPGDINQDDYMNVTDIVMLIDLILNP